MHAERFKRAEMLFTSEDRWRIKYLDKKRWVQGKPQKATVVDSLLWCLLGVCEGVSPSEGTPLLFQLHPTLLMTKVCTEVFVTLHWFFSVCPTNTMFYTSFSMSLLAVNHSLERILQQKLSSAGPVGRDMKSKWGAITMLSQKKWQITSIAHPVPYWNTEAGTYPRIHTLAYVAVNSHVTLNVFIFASVCQLLSLHGASPLTPLPPAIFHLGHCRAEISIIVPVSRGIQVSLPTGFRRARSQKLS